MFFWTKRKIEKKFQQNKNELEQTKFVNEVGGVDTFNDLFYFTKDIGWDGRTNFVIKIRKNAHKEDNFLLNTKFEWCGENNFIPFADYKASYMWEFTDVYNDGYEWCSNVAKFLYYYRTRQNELEVLNKFKLFLCNANLPNDRSHRFCVLLKPMDFKPYIEECRKHYTDDFKENEYKAYIADRFAETMKQHNMKKLRADMPETVILPYYNWYTEEYQEELKKKKFDEDHDFTELNDLVLQRL
jgi:hypothetical protein